MKIIQEGIGSAPYIPAPLIKIIKIRMKRTHTQGSHFKPDFKHKQTKLKSRNFYISWEFTNLHYDISHPMRKF